MSNTTGTTPLSTRRLQELLRGKNRSMVSIQFLGEQICSIERGLASHFSPVWRQRLANATVGIVHVTFPNTAQSASSSNDPSNVPSATPPEKPLPTVQDSTTIPSPRTQAVDPVERNSVKFLVQWMQRGGTDPVGPNALLYPRGNPVALEKLQQLAASLEIETLIARTTEDLNPTKRAPTKQKSAPGKGKKCYKCGEEGHLGKTCVFCRYCKTRGHLIQDCWQREDAEERRLRKEQEHLAFLGREKRRQEKAEQYERGRLAFLERERKRQEQSDREYEQLKQKAVRMGWAAQSADPKKVLWLDQPGRLEIKPKET